MASKGNLFKGKNKINNTKQNLINFNNFTTNQNLFYENKKNLRERNRTSYKIIYGISKNEKANIQKKQTFNPILKQIGSNSQKKCDNLNNLDKLEQNLNTENEIFFNSDFRLPPKENQNLINNNNDKINNNNIQMPTTKNDNNMINNKNKIHKQELSQRTISKDYNPAISIEEIHTKKIIDNYNTNRNKKKVQSKNKIQKETIVKNEAFISPNNNKEKYINNFLSNITKEKQNVIFNTEKKGNVFDENNDFNKCRVFSQNKLSFTNKIIQQKEQKNQQIENKNDLIYNIELEKFKKENDLLKQKNNEKDNELNKLKMEIEKMQKNEANLINIQNKEKEINQKMKELKLKENNLNEKYNEWEKTNSNLKNQISNLESKKNNLIEEIKKCETELSKEKDLINLKNNLNKQINDLKTELNQKNQILNSINTEYNQKLQKVKNERDILQKSNKEKENELNKIKLENDKIKKDKELSISLQEKEKVIDNKMKALKDKEKNLNELNYKYQELQLKNKTLEESIMILTTRKNKLLEEIKEQEEPNTKMVLKALKIEKEGNNQLQNVGNNNNQNIVDNNNNQNIVSNNNNQNIVSNNQDNQKNNFVNPNKDINPNIKIYPPKIQKEPYLNSLYNKPTLIGLDNLDFTPYINSVLQCLSHTRKLTEYFLKDKNKEKIMNNNILNQNPNQLQLCPLYCDLVRNLWKKNANYSSFSAQNLFFSILSMTNIDQVEINFNQSEGAKDFILFFLNRMHKELKKKNNIQNNIQEPLNKYNKDNAFNHFLDEFSKETSIISDLFYGITETNDICQNCQINKLKGETINKSYNYETFNILEFPLNEVIEYREKLVNNNNNINMSNIVNLDDCFNYYQRNDFIKGINSNYCKYCNFCKQPSIVITSTKIYSEPNILIIILTRKKGEINKIEFDFPYKIDITNYVLMKNERKIYKLYGVISYIIKNGQFEEFFATCKSPIDKKWYKYNDSIVKPIKDLKKDAGNFGIPYILFYEKQE